MLPDSQQIALTTKPWLSEFVLSYWEKLYMTSHILQAKQDMQEFLTANLLSIHIITLDIDWGWTFFS